MTASLPPSEVEYLSLLTKHSLHSRLSALFEAGWPLSTLCTSISPPRPKTTVHYWTKNAPPQPASAPPVPQPPPGLPPGTKVRTKSPGVPPDIRPKLAFLAQNAKKYRSGTPKSSPTSLANSELTQIALQLRDFGVPTADIADAAGVSYRAMAKRIANAR